MIAEANGQTVAKTYLGHGDPADEIVACAEKCGADLIVTGRRGRPIARQHIAKDQPLGKMRMSVGDMILRH